MSQVGQCDNSLPVSLVVLSLRCMPAMMAKHGIVFRGFDHGLMDHSYV